MDILPVLNHLLKGRCGLVQPGCGLLLGCALPNQAIIQAQRYPLPCAFAKYDGL